MISPRETIVGALLAKLQTLAQFKTVGREWQGVDNALQTGKLPALYLIERDEKHVTQARGMPSRIDWPFDLIIVLVKPAGSIGLAAINPALDRLDTLFQISKGERAAGVQPFYTLGGLVYDVWIEGSVVKNPSFLGGGACLAVVPLHVRTTNPT